MGMLPPTWEAGRSWLCPRGRALKAPRGARACSRPLREWVITEAGTEARSFDPGPRSIRECHANESWRDTGWRIALNFHARTWVGFVIHKDDFFLIWLVSGWPFKKKKNQQKSTKPSSWQLPLLPSPEVWHRWKALWIVRGTTTTTAKNQPPPPKPHKQQQPQQNKKNLLSLPLLTSLGKWWLGMAQLTCRVSAHAFPTQSPVKMPVRKIHTENVSRC